MVPDGRVDSGVGAAVGASILIRGRVADDVAKSSPQPPAKTQELRSVQALDGPVDSGVEGVPVPDRAVRVTDPLLHGHEFFVPAYFEVVERWYTEHVPRGRDWRSWKWCDVPTLRMGDPQPRQFWWRPGTDLILTLKWHPRRIVEGRALSTDITIGVFEYGECH